MGGIFGGRVRATGWRKRGSVGVTVPVEVDHGRSLSTAGRWPDTVKGFDKQRETRPTHAELLAVLEPGDHRLIDARLCLEHPLGPPKRPTTAQKLDPDELEAAPFLGISLTEPRHATKLAVVAYLPAIRRSIAHQSTLDMPPIGINKVGGRGRPKSSINTLWGLTVPRPILPFRGSVG